MNIFVYGTLCFETVFQKLCGIRPVYEFAELKGFRRVSLNHLPFPGLIKDSSYIQKGLLIRNLPEEHISLFDAYEGALYQRIVAFVSVDNTELEAITYLLKPEYYSLIIEQDWDMDAFANKLLNDYMARW